MSNKFIYISPDHSEIAVVSEYDTASSRWTTYTGDVKVIYSKYDSTLQDGHVTTTRGFRVVVTDYDKLDGDYLTIDGTIINFGLGTTNALTAENLKIALQTAGYSASRSDATVTFYPALECTSSDNTNLTVTATSSIISSSSPTPSFNSRYHMALVWGTLSLMGFEQFERRFKNEIRSARATKSGRASGVIMQYDY